jgi:hypothetical protein
MQGYMKVSLLIDVTDPINPVVTGIKILGNTYAQATNDHIIFNHPGFFGSLVNHAYDLAGKAKTPSKVHQPVTNGEFVVDSVGEVGAADYQPPPHEVKLNEGRIEVIGSGIMELASTTIDLAASPIITSENKSGDVGRVSMVPSYNPASVSYEYIVTIDIPLDFTHYIETAVGALSIRGIGSFQTEGVYSFIVYPDLIAMRLEETGFRLCISGKANDQVKVKAGTSPGGPFDVTVGTFTLDEDGEIEIVDTTASGHTRRFYTLRTAQ